MSATDHLLTVGTAAEKKGCSRQTIYNALDRGDLTEGSLRNSNMRLVVKDEAWEEWEPTDTGRRVNINHPMNGEE
jgi:hypothetical protein